MIGINPLDVFSPAARAARCQREGASCGADGRRWLGWGGVGVWGWGGVGGGVVCRRASGAFHTPPPTPTRV